MLPWRHNSLFSRSRKLLAPAIAHNVEISVLRVTLASPEICVVRVMRSKPWGLRVCSCKAFWGSLISFCETYLCRDAPRTVGQPFDPSTLPHRARGERRVRWGPIAWRRPAPPGCASKCSLVAAICLALLRCAIGSALTGEGPPGRTLPSGPAPGPIQPWFRAAVARNVRVCTLLPVPAPLPGPGPVRPRRAQATLCA